MSAKRILVIVCMVVGASFAALQANDRSFDFTARLLSTPLADPVPQPDMNHFRFGLVGGRWHFRDNNYSINVTTAGLAAAYTRFFDPHWGVNLHLNVDHSRGTNAVYEFSGNGAEFGLDIVRGLSVKPSAFGPLNGSSAFVGVLAWEGRMDGQMHENIVTAGRQDMTADLLTYLLRAGWQGRFFIAQRASMEPAFYVYMQNHSRRVQVDTVAFDDDANPTSYGVAANFNAGFGDVLMPGDALSAGLAGALAFDQNVSWQFQVSYTFGAFNPDPDAN